MALKPSWAKIIMEHEHRCVIAHKVLWLPNIHLGAEETTWDIKSATNSGIKKKN